MFCGLSSLPPLSALYVFRRWLDKLRLRRARALARRGRFMLHGSLFRLAIHRLLSVDFLFRVGDNNDFAYRR